MSTQIHMGIPVLHGRPSRKISLLLMCAFLFLFGSRQAWAAEFGTAESAESARISQITMFLLDGMVPAAGEGNSVVLTLTAQYAMAIAFRPVAGNLAIVRAPQAARPLQRGTVLVVGKVAGNGILATAELFDSATDTWLTAATLTTGRANRSVAFPRTGKSLVWAGIIVPF